jgi:hypothetical protein
VNRYLQLYRTINKSFGFRLRPLGTFGVLQVRQAISAITLGLDRIFFSNYRKQPIDRPIFIIGNPRSGTTFLHRLLLGAGGMAAFELWEMLFPAITARKLLGGIVPRTFTTRACAESRPTTCCGFSVRSTARSRGPTSWPGRTVGAANYPGESSGSTRHRHATKSGSTVTTRSAGSETCSTSAPTGFLPRRAC